nr:MAG: hypothetical protein [Molluscum contagiosum virus]
MPRKRKIDCCKKSTFLVGLSKLRGHSTVFRRWNMWKKSYSWFG